jgi:xanthine/uracil/vitamin C permease (AzgA family)
MLAITTILAAAVGSIVMALYANLPFGLAPGMGLNAYFAFTVVFAPGIPWQTAFAAVFVEGIVFIAMSSIGARRYIIEFFPDPVKFAIGAGIGLFLLLLGLIEINVAVADEATLPLPVAGLISDAPIETVYEGYERVEALATDLGLVESGLMELSFLALEVIPTYRLTNNGLVDVEVGEYVDVIRS